MVNGTLNPEYFDGEDDYLEPLYDDSFKVKFQVLKTLVEMQQETPAKSLEETLVDLRKEKQELEARLAEINKDISLWSADNGN